MKTILLGLNELNFEYIRFYSKNGQLKNFKNLFSQYGFSETTSEVEYQNLEPWIQWATVTTGKDYGEHKIFRLGDIVERKDIDQIFEKIEDNGYKVGAVSPFNAENRLKKPSFFAPDPWTETKASGSKIFVELSKAVSQAVNDNAQGKLTVQSIKALIKGSAKYTSVSEYPFYLKKLSRIKTEIGVKALILDKLLADTFLYEWKKEQPDFANLFLNTGAHFQHHYMFNSNAYSGDLENPAWYCPKDQDPLLEILQVYDQVVGKIMDLPIRLVLATGLHQKPHKHLTYYWRIKEHSEFLRIIGVVDYEKVVPRMSRDFLIEFDGVEKALKAEEKLFSYKGGDGIKIFSIDNRGESLFVELTYPKDISNDFSIQGAITVEKFRKYVAFVAIKNGEHDGTGYVVDTDNRIPKEPFPLKDLYFYLCEDFVKVKGKENLRGNAI